MTDVVWLPTTMPVLLDNDCRVVGHMAQINPM
jgi:hypothetical protein